MKKLLQMIFAVTVLGTSLFAQITSNGTGGGDWNTGTTWIGGNVPTVSDDVVIVSGDSVRLAAAGSCALLTMQSNAKLAINVAAVAIPGTSWSLNSASTVYFNGPTTVQSGPAYGNLVYMSANGGPNGSLTVNGNLTVTTATFRGISATSGARSITVGGNVIISGTGARISAVNSSSATTAVCTYNITGSVSLTGNNSGNRMVCYESAGPHTGSATFNIDGDLNIGTSSQVSLKSSTGTTANFPEGVINLKGNLSHSGVISILSLTSGTSPGLTINFTGTSNQTWSGSGTYDTRIGFPINFTINNSAGVTLGSAKTLSAITSASIVLTLTNGNLTTTTTNLLTIGTNATLSGGSSSSFINGPLSHTWSTSTATRTYPLGKGTSYRPLEISLTTPASPVIRAEVFNGNSGGSSSLNAISIVRYYQTSLVSGTATGGGSAKITYSSDDGVSDHSSLVVAQSSSVNGSYATIDRSASDASSVTSGTSYNPASGDFLILGSSATNALPVEIVSFNSFVKGTTVELFWKTASEINNAGFEVQKSEVRGQTSENNWVKVGFVEGSGTVNSPKSYQLTDNVSAGKTFQYRLKQIDRDGKFSYSHTVEAATGITAEDFQLSQNYPNPFNPSTSINFAVKNSERVTVKVYDLIGQEVAVLFNDVAQPNQLYTMKFDGTKLSSGIYFYTLRSNSRNETKKMLLNK